MKTNELYRELCLFAPLTVKHSPTAAYRALALGTDHIRGFGLFGQMESNVNLGLDTEAFVNCEDFLQLLKSLPDDEFTAQLSGGALRWICGKAKGHLTLMTGDDELAVPVPRFGGECPVDGIVGAEFGKGLELGALACGGTALRAHGLQGVQIKVTAGRAFAYATDYETLSSCCLGPYDPPRGAGDAVTLSAEATNLLATLLQRDREALLTYDRDSLYCVTASTRLLLHQVPALSLNLAEILDQFAASSIKLPVHRAAVAAFLKRAEALSEASHPLVEVAADKGRVILSFSELGSSSQEYYVCEDGPQITVPAVRLEARRLAKALAYARELVFDYAEQNVLILRGDEFTFAVTGRREQRE